MPPGWRKAGRTAVAGGAPCQHGACPRARERRPRTVAARQLVRHLDREGCRGVHEQLPAPALRRAGGRGACTPCAKSWLTPAPFRSSPRRAGAQRGQRAARGRHATARRAVRQHGRAAAAPACARAWKRARPAAVVAARGGLHTEGAGSESADAASTGAHVGLPFAGGRNFFGFPLARRGPRGRRCLATSRTYCLRTRPYKEDGTYGMLHSTGRSSWSELRRRAAHTLTCLCRCVGVLRHEPCSAAPDASPHAAKRRRLERVA